MRINPFSTGINTVPFTFHKIILLDAGDFAIKEETLEVVNADHAEDKIG
jgi:hypothetical protein